MTDILAIISTVAVAMIPMLELPAGVAVGMSLGLPIAVGVPAAVVGTMLQIAFAIPAVDWGYRYGERYPRMAAWLQRIEQKTERHRSLIERFGWLGLALFVLLPLPGSGVWGGTVLSRLLHVPIRSVLLGTGLGTALKGTVIALGLYGAIGVFLRLF